MRAPRLALACAAASALWTSISSTQPAGAPAPPPAASVPAEPEPTEADDYVDPEPIRSDYAAHPGCPQAQEFLNQILARTERARQAEPSEPARMFVVRIEPHPSGSRGILNVRDATGTQATREVVAASCAEVVSALALVSALAIDPQASTSPIETLAPQAPTLAPPTPIDVAPVPPPPTPVTRRADAESQLALGAAIGGEVVWGIAPSAVLAPRFLVEIEWLRQELLSPSARLSVARGERTVDAKLGDARLVWISGRLEACPLRIPATGTLAFRPCAGMEVGNLRGEGRLTGAAPIAEDRLWVAPLVSARGIWQPVGILVVEGYAGITLPLLPTTFVFNKDKPDETRIHEVPPAGGFVGMSLGVAAEVL